MAIIPLNAALPDLNQATNLLAGLGLDANALATLLARFTVEDFQGGGSGDGFSAWGVLHWQGDLAIGIPGLPGASLGIGPGPGATAALTASLLIEQGVVTLRLHDLPLLATLPPGLLVPQPPAPGQAAAAAVTLSATASFTVDSGTGLALEALGGFSLSPAMIGSTGLILVADGIEVTLPGPNRDAAVAIASAAVTLPAWLGGILPSSIALSNVVVDDAGFSGGAAVTYNGARYNPPPAGSGAGSAGTFTGSGTGSLLGCACAVDAFTIAVQHDVLIAATLTGRVALPWFGGPYAVVIALTTGSADTVHLTASANAGLIALPGLPALTYTGLSIDATVSTAPASDASPTVIALTLSQATVTLPGTTQSLSIARLKARLALGRTTTRLEVDVGSVTVPYLGTLPGATLVITSDASGEHVALQASLTWIEVRDALGSLVANLPATLPAPATNDSCTITVSWSTVASASTVSFTVDATIAQPAIPAFAALPPHWRPALRQVTLHLACTAAVGAPLAGLQLTAAFSAGLRLPTLDMGGLANQLALDTGDADGWIALKAQVALQGTSATAQGTLSQILHVRAAGPQGSLDTPLIAIDLNSAGFSATAQALTITAQGDATVRLSQIGGSSVLTHHLGSWANLHGIDPLQATVAATLVVAGSGTATLTCTATFTNGGVGADLSNLINRFTAGTIGAAAGLGAVTFAPKSFTLTASNPANNGAASLALELDAAVTIAGLPITGFFRVSDQALDVGVRSGALPLRVPRFPITTAELNEIGRAPISWNTALYAQILQARLAQQSFPDAGAKDLEAMRVAAAIGLFDMMATIRGRLGTSQGRFGGELQLLIAAFDQVTGIIGTGTMAVLTISEIALHLPWGDPSDVGISGSAQLSQMAAPLSLLNQVPLTLGIGVDRIYLRVQPQAGTVPLPALLGYRGGSIGIGQVELAYGFTDNSFNIAAAGALVLPAQLVADIDASANQPVGIRVPVHSQVDIRLGLIPVPTPLPVVPTFDLDIDLRDPSLPPPAPGAECAPSSDGLQLITPDHGRIALGRFAVSPLVGPLPIPNVHYDGTLMLGTASDGVQLMASGLWVLAGVMVQGSLTPIPFLAEPNTPFVDQLCVNVAVAGFGISAHLQRPFPGFSPLALIELMGLIADPTMPLDPNGALTTMMRVTLSEGQLTVPPALLRLFPDLGRVANTKVSAEIDLGTVISAFQDLWRGAQPVLAALHGRGTWQQRVAAAVAALPVPSPARMLSVLPRELRTCELVIDLGAFSGEALLIIAPIAEAIADLGAPPLQRLPEPPAWGQPSDPHWTAGVFPAWPNGGNGRSCVPGAETLFTGVAAGITAADLQAAQLLSNGEAVVLAVAIELFDGQQFRFVGALTEAGEFALVTSAQTMPLQLPLHGQSTLIALTATERIILVGSLLPHRVMATIKISGMGQWSPIPGMLTTSLQGAAVILGDGSWKLQASASIQFFGTSGGTLNGTLTANQDSCAFAGQLNYQAPAFFGFSMTATGSIGPGPHFACGGSVQLTLCGLVAAQASMAISDAVATISGQWTGSISLPGITTLATNVSLSGTLDLSTAANPTLLLSGTGVLSLPGASISGSAALRLQNGTLGWQITGALNWLNRDWGAAYLIADGHGTITVGGRASFSVDLLPNITFGDVSTATLVVALDLAGHFQLDGSGALSAAIGINGVVQIAIQSAADQTFPLLIARFDAGIDVALNANSNPFIIATLGDGMPVPGLPSSLNLSLPTPALGGLPNIAFNSSKVGVGPFSVTIPVLEWTDVNGNLTQIPGGLTLNDSNPPNIGLNLSFSDQQVSVPLSLSGLGLGMTLALILDQGKLALRAQPTNGSSPTIVHLA